MDLLGLFASCRQVTLHAACISIVAPVIGNAILFVYDPHLRLQLPVCFGRLGWKGIAQAREGRGGAVSKVSCLTCKVQVPEGWVAWGGDQPLPRQLLTHPVLHHRLAVHAENPSYTADQQDQVSF